MTSNLKSDARWKAKQFYKDQFQRFIEQRCTDVHKSHSHFQNKKLKKKHFNFEYIK